MKKKQMTIEDLALMTQRGFSEVHIDLDSFKKEVNERFNRVDERFGQVDKRFDHIENLLLRAHDNRIEKIEDDIRFLKTTLKLR
jgi:archaellum component FlaC